MEQNVVYSHFCEKENLIIPQSEILRYMSCKEENREAKKIIAEFLPVVKNALTFKGSFVYVPLQHTNDGIVICNTKILSKNLLTNLKHCDNALVFALSCGMEVDRLIEKYNHIRPLASLCINSVATAAIECYANEFCLQMSEIFKKDNLFTRPRFSPGYGDFPLDFQPFLLNLTNAGRMVGITLTDKYMMMPSKSVTAIMGISKINAGCVHTGCENCNKKECEFKR